MPVTPATFRAPMVAAAVLGAYLLCSFCEPVPNLTPREEFCAAFDRLGCHEIWGETCRQAYDRTALERASGRLFCPREGARADNCDELAAFTYCGVDP